ncbi:TetR/AcrR family transcriptional regulator [bacterium]|nr:TetR/AcrR family transcriptional regulator [bacterium]MBU1637837.1 TetR/AcrR family transcriptional regulator [bacterium]MBU1919498.1 TetR/AcrR family transcriptional regulator [bacterium]
MGIADRKEREKLEMRAKILDAAKHLFLEEGYSSVSLRRIADSIEYSPSTIYLYFKDKDDILFALHNLAFQELYHRQRQNLQIADPIDRLQAYLSTYLEFALDNREYYDLMFIQYAPASKIKEKAEWRYGRRAYEALRDTIRQCQEAGYLKSVDPDATAFGLWSFVHGLASLIIRHRLPMFSANQREKLAKQAMEMLNEMLELSRVQH